MRQKWEWTAPYHGVSHIKRDQLIPQFSIEEYESFTEALIINHGFSGPRKTFTGPTATADAKAWLERQATALLT